VAAIYARVSTTDQDDKGYSLPTQIDACQAFAMREGYTVPESHVFVDDYTGTSLNRPALTQLRDLVRTQAVSAVIVYDLDRRGRKLAHRLYLTDELEQAGVTLAVVSMPMTEQNNNTRMFVNMRGVIDEYNRLEILEKTERGRRGRCKAGFVPTGRCPLGYAYVRHIDLAEPGHPEYPTCPACGVKGIKGACYTVEPDEAALVQRIFALYVEQGWSQDAIAQQLTREGVPAPGERRPGVPRTLTTSIWHPSAVADILRNETYMGVMHYGKKQRIAGKRNPDKKTRWQPKPREEWIAIPVPAIIAASTFEAAQCLRVQNRRESQRNRKYEYLFVNGRLRCGQCGRAMTGEINGHSHARYKCGRKPYQDVPGTHTRRSVLVAEVEQAVWAAVERVLQDPTLIAQEVERRRQGLATSQGDLDRQRHTYDAELARCATHIKRWEVAYLNEVIDLADFKAKKADIETRRASLLQELAQVDDQQRLLKQAAWEATSLTAYCQRVAANLGCLGTAEKQGALQALNITVVWHPDKPLEITGSIPVDIATNAVQ
jgi:site-specific DNA recombinase